MSTDKKLVISYLTLRRAIGILGFFFPLILVMGFLILNKEWDVQSSISHYYHTSMRDVFVGVLCSYAFFLFSYNGYENKDRIAAKLGSLFALGVAFFPTNEFDCESCPTSWVGTLHFIFAVSFFLVLIYFSLFLFTKTDDKQNMTRQKRKRNTVYHWCGYIMSTCIILLALYFFVFEGKYEWLDRQNPVFVLESVALCAFGVSWLVKGELLLDDKP